MPHPSLSVAWQTAWWTASAMAARSNVVLVMASPLEVSRWPATAGAGAADLAGAVEVADAFADLEGLEAGAVVAGRVLGHGSCSIAVGPVYLVPAWIVGSSGRSAAAARSTAPISALRALIQS